jgi:hypothetical protein
MADSMDAVRYYVEIPKSLDHVLVLPLRLSNRETGSYVDVKARVAPHGMSSRVTLDYVRHLFPEYARLDQSSFERADFTWWSPYFGVTLNNVSESFARGTSTCGRLAPVSGEGSVMLSAGIARSMFEQSESETATKLGYPISWPYQTSIADIRRKAVLILGTDSTDEGLARMKIIQSELSDGSLRGIIIRDLMDPPDMSLEEKVAMFAASASFCVIEDSFPSGAIAELSLLKILRSTVVVLREEGRGSSYMQADYELDSPNIRQFIFSIDPASTKPMSLVDALWHGVRWAHDRKIEKTSWLDKKLPWRDAQALLVEVAGGSWRLRYISEFARHLAHGIGDAVWGSRKYETAIVSAGIDGTLVVAVMGDKQSATIEAPILQDVSGEPSRISYTIQIAGGRAHVVEYVSRPVRDLAELDGADPEQEGLWDFWEMIGDSREPLTTGHVLRWFDE